MWSINHIEWCVKDVESTERQLTTQFGYLPIAQRVSDFGIQRLLSLGDTRFLLTQKLESSAPPPERDYPYLFCCPGTPHKRDSVFNVAIVLSDFSKSVESLKDSERVYSDKSENDSFKYLVVNSYCENVIHVLFDKEHTTLPGFEPIHGYPSQRSAIIKFREFLLFFYADDFVNLSNPSLSTPRLSVQLSPTIDHVTYVVPKGHSSRVIDWYSRHFGMKRFFNDRNDTPKNGIEIEGSVGLRLMVGEWLSSWDCREVGVRDPNRHPTVKLVLAEPLESVETSHVQKFLNEHSGPGIQHIGLAVKEDVALAVDIFTNRGCKFRKPPPTYYKLASKIEDIRRAGESIQIFRRLGLLIDSEADCLNDIEDHNNNEDKYLIQIFTNPLFKEDTFFLEILERRGARGFGTGNITALAQSIILFNEEAKASKNKQ